jgi:hypothetical protein
MLNNKNRIKIWVIIAADRSSMWLLLLEFDSPDMRDVRRTLGRKMV